MILLVDADIVVFRAAFSAEDEEEAFIACSRADQMLRDMGAELGTEVYELWLSGKDNFRYAIYPEYKANRITAKRPKWELAVREYLIREWGAQVAVGEADDALGIRQTELGDNSCIASIDKDMDMIPGWHYNFVKKVNYYVDIPTAWYNFYYQLLVGDTADGVKGVPNIGPVKAKKILGQCSNEREMYQAVLDSYGCYEEFEMNARVLWIFREHNGMWKDLYV